MAVPKKKTSRSRRNMRRSHDALTAVYGIVCSNCGAQKMRHRACAACGYYRGRQVIEIKSAEI
jgi:large subunit ribosomal protein L32